MRIHISVPVRLLATAFTVVVTFFTFMPAPAGAAIAPVEAKSDCGSGYFCVWSSTNYSGTIQRFSATNSYRDITLNSTRSYYNNRSYRTWLHSNSDGGGSTQCINPRSSRSSTSGWQTYAQAAYLATIVNC
ncbi:MULTISPECIES: peptidase inhibitor family I36 protein [unclassified Aeromicrobium]|uniref:peptidase inhibitor family I36 protein n=1 Tax=unclassified Aeromicrobium TaxID=2633570 RepID=UPI00288C3E59|nr:MULTISPECIES: peptidase inhibitor family I36 protein [unclassified Aeromicrobium]